MTYFMHYLKKKKKNSQLSLVESSSYHICGNRLCIEAAA